MSQLDDFNEVKDVAAYLHVSKRHLYNLIASGALGCARVGTAIRIRREDVARLLEKATHSAAAQAS